MLCLWYGLNFKWKLRDGSCVLLCLSIQENECMFHFAHVMYISFVILEIFKTEMCKIESLAYTGGV